MFTYDGQKDNASGMESDSDQNLRHNPDEENLFNVEEEVEESPYSFEETNENISDDLEVYQDYVAYFSALWNDYKVPLIVTLGIFIIIIFIGIASIKTKIPENKLKPKREKIIDDKTLAMVSVPLRSGTHLSAENNKQIYELLSKIIEDENNQDFWKNLIKKDPESKFICNEAAPTFYRDNQLKKFTANICGEFWNYHIRLLTLEDLQRKIKKSPADGNCLLHSLSHELKQLDDQRFKNLDAKTLRTQIADYFGTINYMPGKFIVMKNTMEINNTEEVVWAGAETLSNEYVRNKEVEIEKLQAYYEYYSGNSIHKLYGKIKNENKWILLVHQAPIPEVVYVVPIGLQKKYEENNGKNMQILFSDDMQKQKELLENEGEWDKFAFDLFLTAFQHKFEINVLMFDPTTKVIHPYCHGLPVYGSDHQTIHLVQNNFSHWDATMAIKN